MAKDWRVLGVDLGIKRVGLALSDGLGISVRALPTHQPMESRSKEIEFFFNLCQENKVNAVVIGYPLLNVSEAEGPMAKRARGLRDGLAARFAEAAFSVEVVLADERYSSKEAMKRLISSDIKKSKRKEALDSEVARILVENFLAMRGIENK